MIFRTLFGLLVTISSFLTIHPSSAKDCVSVTDNLRYCDEATWPVKADLGMIVYYRNEDHTHSLNFLEAWQGVIEEWTLDKHVASYLKSTRVLYEVDGGIFEVIDREPTSADGNDGVTLTFLLDGPDGKSSLMTSFIPFEDRVLGIVTSAYGDNLTQNKLIHASALKNVVIGEAP